MRDRLMELLNHKYDHFCDQCGVNKDSHYTESLADYLLENGVIVPPCKVGDVVWLISDNGQYVFDTDVEIVFCDRDGIYIETIRNDVFTEVDFGKTVFLTKEEAEAKLKEGVQE